MKVGPLVNSMASLGIQVSDLPGALSNHSSLFAIALKWFDAQGNAESYEGGRDLDALASL